jgi:hypothetical protein
MIAKVTHGADSMKQSASDLEQERLSSLHATVGGLPPACVFDRQSCPWTEGYVVRVARQFRAGL